MLIVKKLPADKYSRLREIFEDEFHSDVPEAENSDIFVAYEEGKMVGFVLVEDIKVIGQIYAIPEKREGDTTIVKSLVKEMRARFDGKEVVAAVASEPRFEKLFRSLGMHKIAGTFFRKNI